VGGGGFFFKISHDVLLTCQGEVEIELKHIIISSNNTLFFLDDLNNKTSLICVRECSAIWEVWREIYTISEGGHQVDGRR
jgi:hypothetical protein